MALANAGVPLHAIGIVSPYRSELALLNKMLRRKFSEASREIEVNTVDKYQGTLVGKLTPTAFNYSQWLPTAPDSSLRLQTHAAVGFQ